VSRTTLVVFGVEGLLFISAYLAWCWRHPSIPCLSCMDDQWLRVRCPECRGAGRQLRWGAKLLRRKLPKRELPKREE